jgi:hypothetical protein
VAFLAVMLACAVPTTSSFANSAASPRASSPTLLGSLVAADDSSTSSWGRDGGVTVPLPNGQDLWIFADTPRWQFNAGRWALSGEFIRGSSAGMVKYTSGRRPTSRFLEVIPGHPLSKRNKAHQFMKNPRLYLPDGTGRSCSKLYGGSSAEPVRWATGAALLPDKTNVFVPYVDVCVVNAANYVVEGWGFSLYNWKTNKLSTPPFDVFKPKRTGAAIPKSQWYGSPVVVGNNVTMFTSMCCAYPPGRVYTTTVRANAAALKKPASYTSKAIAGVPTNLLVNVFGKSKTRPTFTMFQSSDLKGTYAIFTAASAAGPWTARATGTLPKCATSPQPCTSFAVHPEMSSSSKLIVSYYLPGSGPTIAGHPDRYNVINFAHIVYASIPI